MIIQVPRHGRVLGRKSAEKSENEYGFDSWTRYFIKLNLVLLSLLLSVFIITIAVNTYQDNQQRRLERSVWERDLDFAGAGPVKIEYFSGDGIETKPMTESENSAENKNPFPELDSGSSNSSESESEDPKSFVLRRKR